MKLTQTVSVTREELGAVKGTFADAMGMFIKKSGAPESLYNKSMNELFGFDVKFDVTTASKMGAFKYKMHMTDTIELDITLDIEKAAFLKIMDLSFNVFELILPILSATYEISQSKAKLGKIKQLNDELDAMAAIGNADACVTRTAK